MTIFVSGGTTVNTKVPLGRFVKKYASGEHWYGYDRLFGAETNYSKADESFIIERKDIGNSGYTVTLYEVKNGNLQTEVIYRSEFQFSLTPA